MKRLKLRLAALAAGAVAVIGTACNDFLSGPGIDQDPNNVTALEDPNPLYLGLQTAQAVQFEGQLSRLAAMYTQQIAGVARQFQGYDIYGSQPTDLDPYWQAVYTGGGLLDARRIQRIAIARGDSTYAGVAKVWEALIMGMATSFWGDMPYREALQYAQGVDPTTVKAKYDPQRQVYADVQAQLDTAILFLSKTGGTNIGPTGAGRNAELVYSGRTPAQIRTVYTQVARTLKARFFLHLAELDPSNYARAAAEARQGISSPTNDFNFYHSTATVSQNVHYQFYGTRGDVLPGAAIINLMKSRIKSGKDVNTDRLAFYFYDVDYEGVEDPDQYFGYRPAANPNLPGGDESAFSDLNFVQTYSDFRQPMITFAEAKLIVAEACVQPGSGCTGEAQAALDAVRQNQVYGALSDGPVTFRAQPSVPATLQNIMEQKYIDLFLNPEVWNDYKRTCLPYLAPAPSSIAGAQPGQAIPGRVPYGLSEFSTNAANVPQASATGRNANDPTACPRLTYGSGTPRPY
jgi:hypothetical protein